MMFNKLPFWQYQVLRRNITPPSKAKLESNNNIGKAR